MCKYCNVLSDLRKKDRESYDRTINSYKYYMRKRELLLKRCIIALNWKENEELVDEILKEIGGENNEL